MSQGWGEGVTDVLVLVGSQWLGRILGRLHEGSRFDVFWPCPLPISALHYTHLSALLSSCLTFVFVAGRIFTCLLHVLQLQAQAGILSMR